MKRLKYIAFTVLLASFSLQSCDLERYPLTDLSEDNFWTDDKNAELALTSLYRGSITNGLEYSVSDFWSYHGMLFMEHLTDNAYDRRGENNPFFNISSGKLLNNNLDPEVFVIGGGMSRAGQIVIDYIQKYYVKYVFRGCRDAEFILASLGNDAGMYGAAKLVIEE